MAAVITLVGLARSRLDGFAFLDDLSHQSLSLEHPVILLGTTIWVSSFLCHQKRTSGSGRCVFSFELLVPEPLSRAFPRAGGWGQSGHCG